MSNGLSSNITHLRRSILLAFLFWSAVLIGLLSWTIITEHEFAVERASMAAKATFNKDVALRSWVSKRGGVYVEASKLTPPNNHLSNIPNRDVITPDGTILTLMNPAYFLRQTMNEYSSLYGIQGRITSLQPINPINTPDAWETKVLEMFEKGHRHHSEFTNINGQPYLRYMEAFITVQGCLKCHQHQGYQVGDVRGGVGIAIPMAPFFTDRDNKVVMLSLIGAVIWLIGSLGLAFGYQHTLGRIKQQDQIEQALKEAKEKAEYLSHFDGLTNLRNRRYLNEQLPKEIRRAAREQRALGMMMIDIDSFKGYNDHFGHVSGDKILQQIANALKGELNRPADLIARYGGEEFCILLPNTDYAGVKELAEKLRKTIEALQISADPSASNPVITISVGATCTIPSIVTTPNKLIDIADKALLTAKNAGKNQVVITPS